MELFVDIDTAFVLGHSVAAPRCLRFVGGVITAARRLW
jgi:hypothetical protein